MSRPCAAIARQREAQRIGAVVVDHVERVDHVALRLRHLRALLVADERVDVDGRGTALSFMKCRPIIIMRATQKKMMSKPVTSDAGRVDSASSSGVSSGQPSVENGHSAEENQVSSTSSSRVR